MANYIPLSPSEFWKSLKVSDYEFLCLKCISVGIFEMWTVKDIHLYLHKADVKATISVFNES